MHTIGRPSQQVVCCQNSFAMLGGSATLGEIFDAVAEIKLFTESNTVSTDRD